MRTLPALLLFLTLFACPVWTWAYTTLVGQEITLPEGVIMPPRVNLAPAGVISVDGLIIRNYLDLFSGLIYRELISKGRVVGVGWLKVRGEPVLWLEDEGFIDKYKASGVFRLREPKTKEMSL